MALGLEGDKLLSIVTIFDRDASRRDRSKEAIRAAKYRENRKEKQALAKANDVASAAENHDGPSRRIVTPRSDLSCLLPSIIEGATSEVREERKSVSERARGTRLPPDWKPSEADRQFARDHGVDPDAMLPEFLDYWCAVPGQRGLKTDWSRTWRNRVRDIAKRKPNERIGQARAHSTAGPAQTHGDAIVAGMARYAARRFGGEPSANGGGIPGRDDAAGAIDAERRSESGDRSALPKLAVVPRANTGG